MYQVYGKVRDYNSAADTVSVELEGLGVMDAWFDNLPIDASINRGFLAHGNPVSISVPDEWRIAEGIVVGLGAPPSLAYAVNGTGRYIRKLGRGIIPTDASGAGSLAFLFGWTYASAPLVTALGDSGVTATISGVSTTGATATVSGGPASSYVGFSWEAEGN